MSNQVNQAIEHGLRECPDIVPVKYLPQVKHLIRIHYESQISATASNSTVCEYLLTDGQETCLVSI